MMRHAIGFLTRFWHDEDGGPFIEFALVVTFIALILPAFFDLGEIIESRLALGKGISAGQQYALRFPDDEDGIEQAVEQASGDAAAVEVDVSGFCECAEVTVSCSDPCPNAVMEHYRKIDVTYGVDTLSLYGLYAPESITRTAYVRVQ